MAHLSLFLPTTALLIVLPAAEAAQKAATPAKLPPVTRVGEVSLSSSRMNMPRQAPMTFVSAGASFFLGSDQGGDAPAKDQCTVLDTGASGQGQAVPGVKTPDSKPPTTLDAGDPLTLRAGTQPYSTLPRQV